MKKKAKKAAKKEKRPRNPNDATMRNIRALKKRVKWLELRYLELMFKIEVHGDCLQGIVKGKR